MKSKSYIEDLKSDPVRLNILLQKFARSG